MTSIVSRKRLNLLKTPVGSGPGLSLNELPAKRPVYPTTSVMETGIRAFVISKQFYFLVANKMPSYRFKSHSRRSPQIATIEA